MHYLVEHFILLDTISNNQSYIAPSCPFKYILLRGINFYEKIYCIAMNDKIFCVHTQ